MSTLFTVENMKCGGCSANVEKALAEIDTVQSVEINLETKTVSVEGEFDATEIAAVISAAGYPATPA